MNKKEIIELQKRIGTKPDGFWGPISMAACIAHLKNLMPKPNPWPSPSEKDLLSFYGKPGDESKLVNLDVAGLGVKYEGKTVRTIRVHKLIAPRLHSVLVELSKSHPNVLAEYAGAYNLRKMRGGNKYSLHARGAAIDFMAWSNGLRTHWPMGADMPIEVMEAFARQGFKPAGAFWGRDAMHMEATR